MTDVVTGVLWRLAPGATPRPVDLGFGSASVAYGGDAVWVTNFVSDEIVRVDPQANKVTSRIPLAGTPPSVAADEATTWVSIAGAPRGVVLPASACGAVETGDAEPDVLIASDLPLQGPVGQVTRAAVDAIRFVLRRNQFRAGPHTVGYQSCDDSTGQTGGFDFLKCILGSFRFDPNGDISPASFTVLRVVGGQRRAPELPEGFEGAVVDRVVHAPPAIARP